MKEIEIRNRDTGAGGDAKTNPNTNNNNSSQSAGMKALKLPPFNEDKDDLDAYLIRFERACTVSFVKIEQNPEVVVYVYLSGNCVMLYPLLQLPSLTINEIICFDLIISNSHVRFFVFLDRTHMLHLASTIGGWLIMMLSSHI